MIAKAAAAACLLLTAVAVSGSDAARELARTSSYLRDGRAHRAPFTQTFMPAGFSRARTESGTVVLQGPDFLRFEYERPTKKIFTFDGQTARFYVPMDRQMTQRALTPQDRSELPVVFLDDPAALEKRYAISVETSGDGVALLLRPRSSDSEIAWIRLRIGADGGPAAISYANAAGDLTRIDFGPFETRPPMPPEQFQIKPPPGTRILKNESDKE